MTIALTLQKYLAPSVVATLAKNDKPPASWVVSLPTDCAPAGRSPPSPVSV